MSYTHKYFLRKVGADYGKKCYNYYLEFLKHNTLEQIQNMDLDGLIKLCSDGINIGHIYTNKLKTLEALDGIKNINLLRQQHDIYKDFKDKHTAQKGRKNLTRNYTYYTAILNNFLKDDLINGTIDPDDLIAFIKNKHKSPTAVVDSYMFCLEIMGVHAKYKDKLKQLKPVSVDNEYSVLWDKIRNECGTIKQGKHTYHIEPYTQKHISFTIFKQYINDLFDYVENITQVPSLSYNNCLEYCKSKGKEQLLGFKVFILKMLDSPHIEALYNELVERNNMNNFINKMNTHIHGSKEEIRNFSRIIGYNTIQNMDNKNIKTLLLNKCNNSKVAYNIIKYQLENCGRYEDIQYLENNVDARTLGITKIEQILNTPWKKTFYADIITSYCKNIENNSSYPDQCRKKYDLQIANIMEFIENYTQYKYPNYNKNFGPLRWFINSCSKEMVYDMVLEYGKQANCNNDMVKSTSAEHHAKKDISIMLSFFKIHCKDKLLCGESIADLNPMEFLTQIENLRVQYDPSIQRTYTDEEVERMIKVAKDINPINHLMILMLREIGLRAGCMRNITYHDMFQENKTPRMICRVLEKKKSVREFQNGPNILSALAMVRDYIDEKIDHEIVPKSFYIFNENDHTEPCPLSTFEGKIKNIGRKAGIETKSVHPHVFRHTIVGKLMDVGNSIEDVSKFIGHSNTNTTIKHYWLRNPEEIVSNMKNPFLNNYTDEEEKRADYEIALENVNKRLEASLQIINVYNTVIARGIKDNTDSQQIKQDIFNEIPNLQLLLKNIASPDDGTVTTYL